MFIVAFLFVHSVSNPYWKRTVLKDLLDPDPGTFKNRVTKNLNRDPHRTIQIRKIASLNKLKVNK